MKHNTNRPQVDKKNGTFKEGDLATSNKIQQHLEDKNHQISDEDFGSFTIAEEDLDEESKSGLESPWNIFS